MTKPRKQPQTKGRKHYWDTSVFLALLMNQQAQFGPAFDAAADQLRQMLAGKLVIVTSEIIRSEVLVHHMGQAKHDQFLGYLDEPNLMTVGVDPPIAQKAGDLRSRCLDRRPQRVRLAVADALHAATALLYGVDEINSLDDRLNNAFGHAGETAMAVYPRRSQLGLTFPSDADVDDATDPS